MQHAVPTLHEIGVFILLVVGFVLVSHEALAPLHPADHREALAAVLGQCHSHRAAQSRPGCLSRLRVGGTGGIVGNGDPSALQLQGADAGIVVGQRRSLRLRPGLAPVKGLAAVDPVGLAVPHEGHQMSRLQLDHIGMNMAVALRHHHHMPALSLIIRDAEGGRIPGQAVHGIRAEPVGKDPSAVGQHLNGLPAEGALLRENRGVVAPGSAAVGALLTAHHGCILHIVLTLLPIELGGIHGPDRTVRSVEEGRILLTSGGIL